MEWIKQQTDKAKEHLFDYIPNYWTDLRVIIQDWIKDSILPETIIPIACCKAVGGKPKNTISIATSLIASLMSVRILDDLQDRDKPEALWAKVGSARAFNYAYALQNIAFHIMRQYPFRNKKSIKLFETYIEGALVTLAGQDRDLKGVNKSWDDYWRTAEMKTCYITSTGAAMGALTGTNKEKHIEACKLYGYHWGLCLQILNDLEGIWFAHGKTDLDRGKLTLPILYGMRCQHAAREELSMIIWKDQIINKATRIRQILDNIDTKSYLISAALDQRTKALEAIKNLPDKEGKKALEYYITTTFGDIDELLRKTNITELEEAFKIPEKSFRFESKHPDDPNRVYNSPSLKIRDRIRISIN